MSGDLQITDITLQRTIVFLFDSRRFDHKDIEPHHEKTNILVSDTNQAVLLEISTFRVVICILLLFIYM